MKKGFNMGLRMGTDTIQTTLDGVKLRFLKVRTSDGYMLEWGREAIVKQLLRETELSEGFYGFSTIDEGTVREIEANKNNGCLATFGCFSA